MTAIAHAGTITGNLQGPSGLPVKNATISFALQQAGLTIGYGNVVPVTASCYTSSDGSVVGLPNPLALPSTSIVYGSGTMAAGIYYVAYSFYDASGNTSLPSPELQVQLTGTGSLLIAAPASFPSHAAGMTVYIGTASGAETGQGNTVGATQTFTQSLTPVPTAIALPVTNNSVCSLAFNDTIIPYSGYNVSLTSANGNAYPGFPQAWQLNGGLTGTVNISNGAPLWNGVVVYPQPIFAQPLNHGPQSISGLLNLTGYNLVNVGNLGAGGNSTPAFPIDVIGYINTTLGYLVAGHGGTIGQCLVSNGTFFAPGSCGTPPTVYYQYLLANGAIKPQEPYFNFATRFTATDNPGSARTDVDLATTVTAGSCTSCNVTYDAYGRVTSTSNGPAIPVIKSIIINSGICATANSAYAQCTKSATWGTAFADSAYALTCTPFNPTANFLSTIFISAKSASGFTVTIQNEDTSGANSLSLSEIDCVGFHP